MQPNSSVEHRKLAFQEECSFQIYDSFSTNTKKNGSFLVSSINTKIGVIFQGLVDKFCRLEQRKKFLLCTVPFFLVECPREAHVFPTSPTSPCLSLFLLLPPTHKSLFSLLALSSTKSWRRRHTSSSNPPHPPQSSTKDQRRMAPTSSSTTSTITSSRET